MQLTREWAMPNHNTFSIKPIRKMIEKYVTNRLWLDPFSRNSPFANKCVTNDLSPDFVADYHLESLEFMKLMDGFTFEGVLFDPPYSPRQISECYNHVGRKVHMVDTQSSFYGDRKDIAAKLVKPNGFAICFGWNSQGFGKTRGFEMIEILLVAHGGAHNDTICTVERKL